MLISKKVKSIENFIKRSHEEIKKTKDFKSSLKSFLDFRKKMNNVGSRDTSPKTLGKVLKVQASFEDMDRKFFVNSKSKCLEKLKKEKIRLTQGMKATFQDKDVDKAFSIARTVCEKSTRK